MSFQRCQRCEYDRVSTPGVRVQTQIRPAVVIFEAGSATWRVAAAAAAVERSSLRWRAPEPSPATGGETGGTDADRRQHNPAHHDRDPHGTVWRNDADEGDARGGLENDRPPPRVPGRPTPACPAPRHLAAEAGRRRAEWRVRAAQPRPVGDDDDRLRRRQGERRAGDAVAVHVQGE